MVPESQKAKTTKVDRDCRVSWRKSKTRSQTKCEYRRVHVLAASHLSHSVAVAYPISLSASLTLGQRWQGGDVLAFSDVGAYYRPLELEDLPLWSICHCSRSLASIEDVEVRVWCAARREQCRQIERWLVNSVGAGGVLMTGHQGWAPCC